MDIPPGASGVVGGLISIALLQLFANRAARRNAEAVGGKQVLRYGSGVRMMGWIALVLGLSALYVASLGTAEGPAVRWTGAGCFFAACLMLFLEFRCVAIWIDGDGIETRSPWRKARRIPWTAVRSYGYSDVNYWHRLTTEGFGIVRVSSLLSGVESLHEILLTRAEVQGIEHWRSF